MQKKARVEGNLRNVLQPQTLEHKNWCQLLTPDHKTVAATYFADFLILVLGSGLPTVFSR